MLGDAEYLSYFFSNSDNRWENNIYLHKSRGEGGRKQAHKSERCRGLLAFPNTGCFWKKVISASWASFSETPALSSSWFRFCRTCGRVAKKKTKRIQTHVMATLKIPQQGGNNHPTSVEDSNSHFYICDTGEIRTHMCEAQWLSMPLFSHITHITHITVGKFGQNTIMTTRT